MTSLLGASNINPSAPQTAYGQLMGEAKMKLSEAPTSAILAEIKKFQNAQKRYPVTSEIHADIGKQLAPLFNEMARRQA